MALAYFAVKNLERFQHYKDRRPPWIKLYQDVLEDYEFTRLPDASKMHLLAIWLLASRTDNRTPYDPEWIGRAIHATEPVNLDRLLSAGFITLYHSDSDPLASCPVSAIPETEVETEEESKIVTDARGEIVGVVIGQPADYALALTIAANHAVTKRWGEQATPYMHGQSYDLTAVLQDAAVPLETAKLSLASQCERVNRSAPPKSINYFRPGILADYEIEKQIAIQAKHPPQAGASGDVWDRWIAQEKAKEAAHA